MPCLLYATPAQEAVLHNPASSGSCSSNPVICTSQRRAQVLELHTAKQAAVAAEDYDTAKQLKAALDRLRGIAGRIAVLEARKCEAATREDYDLAKQLKQEVRRRES